MTTKEKKEMAVRWVNELTSEGKEKLAILLLEDAFKNKTEKQITSIMTKVLF